jgi:hypothetical protein
MASLLNGSLAASPAPVPEMRLLYMSQSKLTVDICMASLFLCTYNKGESVLNAEHLFFKDFPAFAMGGGKAMDTKL